MEKRTRFIKNRTGRKPVVCNINKERKEFKPAWRASVGEFDKHGLIVTKGETRNLALIQLAKIVNIIPRKDFRKGGK